MKILVINAGSSSLKYQLIDMDDESVVAKGICERIGIEGSALTHKVPGKEDYKVEQEMPSHKEAIKLVLDALMDAEHGVVSSADEIAAVGHRVLHGGLAFTESVVVDEDVKKAIRANYPLGPLHNPANLTGINACEHAMPGKTNVAVFDTTFGMSMPDYAYLYGIDPKYLEKYGIRRYGFHGTSHMFVSGETIAYGQLPEGKQKVIVCHLGNGSSISASVGGKCVDTSMGLTPLEGLIMGTRSGDIDPSVVQFLMTNENLNVDEVMDILNKKSGVAAMSGVSSDFRDLNAAAEAGNERAQLALNAFCYRVRKYIGSYAAAMNGVDAISFTGGIGENDTKVRKMILDGLTYLGVEIDPEKAKVRGERAEISTPGSKVRVFVLPTNEELAIARETVRVGNL